MEHRPPSHDIIHAPSLEQIGFEEYEPPEGFCPLWRSYRGEGETSGSFHILAPRREIPRCRHVPGLHLPYGARRTTGSGSRIRA